MENRKEYPFITTEVITRKYYVIKKRSRRPEFIGLTGSYVGRSKFALVDVFKALECNSTTDAQSWLETYLEENKDEKREDFDIVLLEMEVKYPKVEYTW